MVSTLASRPNFLKEKLQAGQAVLGTWAVIPSEVTADVIAAAGLDFVIIDAEHGPIGFETAQRMAMACESRGVSPVMRVGGVIEAEVLRALDIGVHGLQVPNITRASDAEQVISFARFPPLGSRGFSPFTRAGGYSLANATALPEHANENTLVILNLESEECLAEVERIAALPGVDVFFIGLFDFSKSLGLPGQVDHPVVLSGMERICTIVRKAGKAVGTIATNEERMGRFCDMGMQYIVYLVDCEMLRSAYHKVRLEFDRVQRG
jgi:4-hydroxy-2-oxoheptanedioate aldolase